jgi:acyl-CoA synthetase (AMP-forming)/AMP-acid ligase II
MSGVEESRPLVLPAFLERTVRRLPDKDALVFEGERRTYAELDARARRLAAALAERGVGAGDRVAMLLHNGLEFVETLIACHKLGACAVPVNFRLVADEVRYVLADAEAVGIVSAGELDAIAAEAAAGVASVGFHLGGDYEAALAATAPLEDPVPVAEDDPALVMYTSGTTGRPKGAVLTHRGLVASTLSWITEMQAGEEDVWLSGQPLFHIGGINGLLPFLFLGGTCVYTPTTGFDAGRAIALLEEHAVTMCIFVPTQWQQICDHPRMATMNRRRLRVAMWSASPASRPLLELMGATFPDAAIVSAYGQTEMSGATTLLKGPDATRKMGSVGKPMLGVDLRLVDDDGRDVAPGEVGEVVYRGPFVMAGYHGNEEATRDAFAGGWFHSGDLAVRDDEGYLRLVDRKKDLIISGGENVYPAEVERVLAEHPGVADAAVVGVPHPRWVETPVAFVVPDGDDAPTKEELVAHCRERLAGYKKPSAVVFVEALPRNAAGKVLKRELRKAQLTRFG